MGLEFEEEDTLVSRYRILTRCVLCAAANSNVSLTVGRFENSILNWLTNAGIRLSMAELVYLHERNIEPTKDLLYTDIDVNHTLVYYDHRTDGSKKGCYFNVNTPKTPAGKRKVPMLSFVKEAIIMEKERQELLDLHCIATIDGYTDFIFINRFGNPQHQGTLNKAIRRIIRDCNDEQFLKNENPEVLLPHFSCHSLRHTFTTRMCEAGVNVKVIQDTLGHKDISTTLNIYTDVTKELRQSEFEGLLTLRDNVTYCEKVNKQ